MPARMTWELAATISTSTAVRWPLLPTPAILPSVYPPPLPILIPSPPTMPWAISRSSRGAFRLQLTLRPRLLRILPPPPPCHLPLQHLLPLYQFHQRLRH